MLLSKKAKIEAVCGKDETRVHLMSPYLDLTEAGKPQLVATDGHALVALEIKTTEGDVSGYVAVDAIKALRKEGPNAEMICNGTCVLPSGATIPRPSDNYGTFPDWRQVTPGERDGEQAIAFNVDLLKKIVQAAGGDDRVRLFLAVDDAGHVDPREPIRVQVIGTDTQHRAVLMPICP